MTEHYRDESVVLHHGDCLEVLRTLDDASIDAVVTDPPYGLEFMGKEWDRRHGKVRHGMAASYGGDAAKAMRAFQAWCEQWAAECFRVLKPGGHLLAFGGSRTVHRLASGIEDAGFEIRDSIMWLYGSGFPKSMDVAKAIDRQLGVEGTLGEPKTAAHANWIERGAMRGQGGSEGHEGWQSPWMDDPDAVDRNAREYLPGSEEGARWKGWGTALKPAHEPIVVARKPITGTVAANVLEHGTGALNIDGTRVAFASEADEHESKVKNQHDDFGTGPPRNTIFGQDKEPKHNYDAPGRWPANVVLDPAMADELDEQSGTSTSSGGRVANISADTSRIYGGGKGLGQDLDPDAVRGDPGYGDRGGASRYFPVFRYEPKAGSAERPTADGEAHPTVKPLDLMRWLVRLVCPPDGVVLEPFAGSGTTAEACVIEGMRCVAIEKHAPYLALIVARLSKPIQIDLLAQLGGAAPAGRDLREPSADRTYKHDGAVEFTGRPGPRWDAKPKKEEATEPML